MTKTIMSAGHKALVLEMTNARKTKDITQAELASTLKCQQSLIARIESGQRRVDVVDMVRWARAVGSEPSDFLRVVEAATAQGS